MFIGVRAGCAAISLTAALAPARRPGACERAAPRRLPPLARPPGQLPTAARAAARGREPAPRQLPPPSSRHWNFLMRTSAILGTLLLRKWPTRVLPGRLGGGGKCRGQDTAGADAG
jgi:hypothetical protein